MDPISDYQSSGSTVATAFESPAFVQILSAPDVDAVTSAGLLVSALTARSIPYQARIRPWSRTAAESDEPAAISLSIDFDDRPPEHVTVQRDSNFTGRVVMNALDEIGFDPDLEVLLAGMIAYGGSIDDLAGVPDRIGGIASPTANIADGLAHSTWVHGPYSGDVDRAAAVVDGCRNDDGLDRVALASAVSLETVANSRASHRAGLPIDLGINPHAAITDRYFTIEGLADLLRCSIGSDPARVLAAAAGHDVSTKLLSSWRDHARRVHESVRSASFERYDGFILVRDASGPIASTARLLRDFFSPEPIVAVVASHRVGVSGSSEGDRSISEFVDAGIANHDLSLKWRSYTRNTGLLQFPDDFDTRSTIEAINGVIGS